jgi:post-segregation antitoxin (ccd killing protein)
MSKRIKTTLTLDDEVVNRAKELDINLSAVAERGII